MIQCSHIFVLQSNFTPKNMLQPSPLYHHELFVSYIIIIIHKYVYTIIGQSFFQKSVHSKEADRVKKS